MISNLRNALAAAAALVLTGTAAPADEALSPLAGPILVTVDRAAVFGIPHGTTVIAIGNAAIADVVTPASGMAVVTGKAFGQTNVLLMDASGKRIGAADIRVVQASAPFVTLRRGPEKRETYSCTPVCEPALALGDSPEVFTSTSGQITQRQTMSATAPARGQ